MGSKEENSELKLVQDLAENGHGLPPASYILPDEHRQQLPAGAAAPPPLASDVPIINLCRLDHDDHEAQKLSSAVRSLGLFQAIGHDLSPSFLDQVHEVARKFFQLPREVKEKYSNLCNGEFKLEGYGNDHVATQEQVIDWNDRLYLQVQPDDKKKLELWPDNPSSFREILDEFTMKTRKITDHVLLALAKLLKLDENYFVNQLDERADVHARFTYYPRCPRPDLVFGIKPHSDASVVTIILPDKEVEGLQVLTDRGWENVPIIPNALLINLGNQMEIMSNGIYKSPMHRVVTGSIERISLAMFYVLEQEKIMEPAPGLVDETRPCLYRKMKTKDFLEIFFRKFAEGETTMDWLRV